MAKKDEDNDKRERRAHIGGAQPSADNEERQGALQKQAVERYEAQNEEVQQAHARVNINTKLVTKEFKGNVPNEPFKSDEEEDNKVGRFGFGAGVKDALKEVKAVPLEVAGRVVDQIVVEPKPAGGQVAGATPETEPQRVQRVLDKHFGRDKEKGSKEDQEAREEAEHKAAGTEA